MAKVLASFWSDCKGLMEGWVKKGRDSRWSGNRLVEK